MWGGHQATSCGNVFGTISLCVLARQRLWRECFLVFPQKPSCRADYPEQFVTLHCVKPAALFCIEGFSVAEKTGEPEAKVDGWGGGRFLEVISVLMRAEIDSLLPICALSR